MASDPAAGVPEARLQALIAGAHDAVYVLADDRLVFVNPRFADLFAYDAAALTAPGFDLARLVDDGAWPLVQARRARAAAGAPLPRRYEFRARRADGDRFDAEVSVSAIEYLGRPATLGVLQDVTERKAYEKQLLRKNHELSVLNAVSEAITRVDDLGSVLDGVMERLIELLGVDAAGLSLLDDADDTRFAAVHYRGCSETFVARMRRRRPDVGVLGLALTTRRLQVIEAIADDPRVAKGAAVQEGFRSAVALPLTTREHTCGVISVFTRAPRRFGEEDIRLFSAVAHQLAVAIDNARLYHAAREGVRRLEAQSEIARAIGSTLDVEGVFRIVGERLAALVPYRRIALLIARPDRAAPPALAFSVRTLDRPPPGAAPLVQLQETLRDVDADSPLRTALRRRRALTAREGLGPTLRPSPQGAAAVVPIRADDADMGLFVLSVDDADQLRAKDVALLDDLAAHMAISLKNARTFQDLQGAYRDLEDAQERLVRSEKLQSLGELAAGVAHDFNNVLSAILGRAQMMSAAATDPAVRADLQVIERAALDGAGTVRRIQAFAKVQSDRAFVVVRLNPLAREVVERCAPRLDAAGPVEVQLDLNEVPPVLGLPSELREVVTNLVHNALDAMPHGGRLELRTGADASGAFLDVADTGYGMTAEVQRRVFDPFFTTKGERGTGLGMSVSYSIIQRHGGDLSVTSSPGAGTTVRLRLPAAAAEAPIPHTPVAVETGWLTDLDIGGAPEEGAPTDARILVIDDDVAVRDVLADILRGGALDVVAAGTGEEGMTLFEASEFDVVVTDLGMPGMNGWEVAQEVKRRRPGTRVGLITGWGATLDPAEVAERGVDFFVPKPFRLDHVLREVRRALSAPGSDD